MVSGELQTSFKPALFGCKIDDDDDDDDDNNNNAFNYNNPPEAQEPGKQ